MIPVLASGRSFKAALLYYGHDKQSDADAASGLPKPTSTDRVGFIETRNLAHDDIDGSFVEMLGTLRIAPLLKQQAGLNQGRPLLKPVQTVALSFHPSERPDRATKLAAADSFLAAMGWQEHQAIIIEHTDTPHAHVHLILNRVHPDTGRTLESSNDRRRAQAWAQSWDRQHGHDFCPARREAKEPAAPGERAEQKVLAKRSTRSTQQVRAVPRQYDDLVRAAVAEFRATEAALSERLRSAPIVPGPLASRHNRERATFMDSGSQFEQALRYEVYSHFAETVRPEWRGHFRYARVVTARARAAAANEEKLARQFVKDAGAARSEAARQKLLARAEQHFTVRTQILATAQAAVHDDKRALVTAVRRGLRSRLAETSAAFTNERYAAADALIARQADEGSDAATLMAARAAGRRYDAKRLEALLKPDALPERPAPTERIARILSDLDQAPHTQRRKIDDRPLRFGASRRRRTDQAIVGELDRLLTAIRELTAAADRDDAVPPQQSNRLAAFVAELDAAAETGAREVLRRSGSDQKPTWQSRNPAERARARRAIVTCLRGTTPRERQAIDPLVNPEQARTRALIALAATFDPADPFASLVAAVVAEHAAFLDDCRHLRDAGPAVIDPGLRDLALQAAAADHLAVLAWRNGRLAEIRSGCYSDPTRGHTARTRFLTWLDAGAGVPDYGPMTSRRSADAPPVTAFARHDAARTDAALLRHAIAAVLKEKRKSEAGTAISAVSRTAMPETQVGSTDPAQIAEQYLRDKEREIDAVARYGTADPDERRRRKRSLKGRSARSNVVSTGFRLADYEITRLWQRGEWRMVRRPPPVAVLHTRRILHSAADCPFCRLDWGRCPTHLR